MCSPCCPQCLPKSGEGGAVKHGVGEAEMVYGAPWQDLSGSSKRWLSWGLVTRGCAGNIVKYLFCALTFSFEITSYIHMYSRTHIHTHAYIHIYIYVSNLIKSIMISYANLLNDSNKNVCILGIILQCLFFEGVMCNVKIIGSVAGNKESVMLRTLSDAFVSAVLQLWWKNLLFSHSMEKQVRPCV